MEKLSALWRMMANDPCVNIRISECNLAVMPALVTACQVHTFCYSASSIGARGAQAYRGSIIKCEQDLLK